MVIHLSPRHRRRAKAKAQSVFGNSGCISHYSTFCAITGCIDGWQLSPSSSTGSRVECSLKRSSWMESCIFMNFVAVTSNPNAKKLMPTI